MQRYDGHITILRKTLATAEALARIASKHMPAAHPSSSSPSLSSICLSLPVPESLACRLAKLGVDAISARRISAALDRAEARLRDVCQADFRRRCDSPKARYFSDDVSSSRIVATYFAIYNTTTRNWRSYIIENFVPRYLQARKCYEAAVQHKKRPFNQVSFGCCGLLNDRLTCMQGAVPFLERFFHRNAFPSRLDKYELAAQCDMDYKQIHVWVSDNLQFSAV